MPISSNISLSIQSPNQRQLELNFESGVHSIDGHAVSEEELNSELVAMGLQLRGTRLQTTQGIELSDQDLLSLGKVGHASNVADFIESGAEYNAEHTAALMDKLGAKEAYAEMYSGNRLLRFAMVALEAAKQGASMNSLMKIASQNSELSEKRQAISQLVAKNKKSRSSALLQLGSSTALAVGKGVVNSEKMEDKLADGLGKTLKSAFGENSALLETTIKTIDHAWGFKRAETDLTEDQQRTQLSEAQKGQLTAFYSKRLDDESKEFRDILQMLQQIFDRQYRAAEKITG